jgi:hypothetical protein
MPEKNSREGAERDPDLDLVYRGTSYWGSRSVPDSALRFSE